MAQPRVVTIAPGDVVAFGFDTNVLLRLGDNSRTDVVDFLGSRHPGPIIVPGQVVQEFWNNILAGVDMHSELIRKKTSELGEAVGKIGADFEPYSGRMASILEDFTIEHGFVLDVGSASRVASALAFLKAKARVPFVPRSRFLAIADVRDRTRTPPGFKDPGLHGDFFVWADFLAGLLLARAAGEPFSAVAFVTNEKKPDWTRQGRAHPILVAEVAALVDVPFELWDMATLARYIEAQTTATTVPGIESGSTGATSEGPIPVEPAAATRAVEAEAPAEGEVSVGSTASEVET